jgi:hypothetical protein
MLVKPLEHIQRDHIHSIYTTPSMNLHCWWFQLVVCMDLLMTKVWTQKISFFTPITFDSLSLETNISYRKFWTIFSDIWTVNSAELNFIIGGGRIVHQKVQHAGPAGLQAYHALNFLPKADVLFTVTYWLASLSKGIIRGPHEHMSDSSWYSKW